MVPRLILVEGPPGCGKSTTAQFLARELRREGRSARWHYEEETPHPVLQARYTGTTWEGYSAERLERWARFATEVEAGDEVRIVESTLLQTPILTMLREDAGADVILAFLRRLQAQLRSLSPLLIYLRHPEPDAAVLAILARRGSNWEQHHVRTLAQSTFASARGVAGVDGLRAYWREHAALCERAVATSPLSTLIVDVSNGDWAELRRVILDRLALSGVADEPVPEAYLRRFVGTYSGGSNGSRECSIDLRDGGLVLTGLLWPSNPLLPKAPGAFDIESWPLELYFEEDDHGIVRRMRAVGPAFGWGRIDGVFERA